ncbi:MAG: RNA polymerase factor sigma-54 [Oscillospiraceae bacterium]
MSYKFNTMGQVLNQSLKQSLSTQQIQYVKLLQMNTLEFNRYLNELHLENPVVELEPPTYQPPVAIPGQNAIDLAHWIASRPVQRSADDPNDGGDTLDVGRTRDEERDSLQAYLRSQFDLCLTDLDLSLMERLICSLDEHGYLVADVSALVEMGWSEELVLEAISYLQSLDPPGVGARDLSECLAIQLRRRKMLVREHLEDLAQGHFQKAARIQGCPTQQVRDLYQVIRTLSPRPASSFGGETAGYVLPEVTVVENNGHLSCVYNRQYNAGITINEGYLRLAQNDPSAQEYINRKLSQAMWVVKAIQSRQGTIERIVNSILEWQQAFFLNPNGSLSPMRLRDVSEQLGIHESTVSRAINEKYLQCRRGVFPLKYFFSGSPHSRSHDATTMGSRSIKEHLRAMVAAEDPVRPLSDSELAARLSADGIQLARRTVAKYREELGISSSTMRRQ